MSDDHTEAEDSTEPRATGWTKAELMAAADMSGKTFDTVRKAARIKGPTHGRLKHVFDEQDMFALIQKVGGGRYSVMGPAAAQAWIALLDEAGVTMPEVISRARRMDRPKPPKPLPGTPWR